MSLQFAQSSFVYFNYSLQDAIRRLHEFGYQGIEVWGGRPHMYRHDLDNEIPEIASLLARSNMVVANFIPAQFRYPSILCSLNEAVRQDSVAYIKGAIDNALRLGSPSVSVCPGMTLEGEPLEKGWAQLKQSIIEVLDYSDKTALKILIEPAHQWETTLIRTVSEGLQMIDEIKSERLGICFDTGHAHVNGEDFVQVVEQMKRVPFHIHIDDNDGTSDSHHMPGAGKIDFAPFASALHASGYAGFVSAELGFQYTLNPDSAVRRTFVVLNTMFS